MARVKIFAHRGGARRGPENTLAAFAQAIGDGADGFECDVRLTADGEPVIVHDDDLRRVTGAPVLVSRSRFAEVRALRVLGSDQRIPHLDEVLELAALHEVEGFLELKGTSERLAETVIARLRASRAGGRWWIMAFATRRRILDYVKTLDGPVRTIVIAVLPVDLCRTVARCGADAVSFGFGWKFRSYALFRTLDACISLKAVVRRAQARAIPVTAGIANEVHDILRLADYGLDAIFTDVVPTARAVLEDHGRRPPRPQP